jgi:hypothetical protein
MGRCPKINFLRFSAIVVEVGPDVNEQITVVFRDAAGKRTGQKNEIHGPNRLG